jgi:hypothetical protein
MSKENMGPIINTERLDLSREFFPEEEIVLNALRKGNKVNYLIAGNKMIFTTGTQSGLLEQLGLTEEDCQLSDGYIELRAGYLTFANPEHKGKHNIDDLGLMRSAAKTIKLWLKEKGIDFK